MLYYHALNFWNPWEYLIEIKLCHKLCLMNGANRAVLYLHPQSFVRPSALKTRMVSMLSNIRARNTNFVSDLFYRKRTFLKADGIEITVQVSPSFLKSLSLRKKALSRAAYSGIGYGHHSDCSLGFLRESYSGVEVGRFASAIALRRDPTGGGDLDRSSIKALAMADCLTICDYVRGMNCLDRGRHYFSARDEAYQGGVYEQAMFNAGAQIISRNSPVARFKLVESWSELKNQRSVKRSTYNLSIADREKCEEYMETRFRDPLKALPYMRFAMSNTDESFSSFDTLKQVENYFAKNDPNGNGVTAVLCLHAFSDAQYLFGLDGFKDLFQWTINTLDSIIANSDVTAVIIKPHPNVDSSFHKGDEVAFRRIKKKVASIEKVFIVAPSIQVESLVQLPGFVGITHHGSIAEEITYLRKPVISSIFSPWSDYYDFCWTWTTPEDYFSILGNIKNISRSDDFDYAMNELFCYLKDARFASYFKRDRFLEIFESHGGSNFSTKKEKVRHISRVVSNHRGSDFSKFLEPPIEFYGDFD